MVDYATSLAGIIGATFIPVYFALYLIPNLKFIRMKYLAATGVGLSMWYFFDTMNDAVQLYVNSSFSGGLPQLGLVLTFIFGVIILAVIDYAAVPSSPTSGKKNNNLFLIPLAIAVVMGIHGLAEGWAFGTAASLTGNQTLVEAFGGLYPLASYPMHKCLEAVVIAIVYTAYVRWSGVGRAKWEVPVLGLAFGLSPLIGTAIGYFNSVDITYFYAFGATAAIYAILRLVGPINENFKVGENAPAYFGPKVFAAAVIGVLLLYGAALFH